MKGEGYNIYKPGTTEYYRDVLQNISAVCIGYDGMDDSIESLKELVDDLREMALSGLNHKKQYIRMEDDK